MKKTKCIEITTTDPLGFREMSTMSLKIDRLVKEYDAKYETRYFFKEETTQKENENLMTAAPLLLDEHIMDLKHLKTWRTPLINAGMRGTMLFEEFEDMIKAKKKAIEKATPNP